MTDENQAPETARVASAPEPDAAEPAAPAAADAGDGFPLDMMRLLAAARAVPWESVDLECPPAAVDTVGAELVEAWAIVSCDCGQKLRIVLDGDAKSRCPKCKTVFRHLLAIQAEDATPSAAAAIIGAILDSNRPDGV